MRTPRNVDVEITARCNLRCRYCYFFDNPAVDYRDLPTDEWLEFFDELGALGVMNITLAGGEPFIREDLPTLIQGIVRNRMRFSILSNGALINDEIAMFIAATHRCDYVQVSVDGSRPEIHDSCRGKGSFDRAIRGIRTLQRNKVKVVVRVTIHHHNVHDLENIAQLLLENLGLEGFGTNSAGYLGTCRLNSDDVMLTIQDRQAAMEMLLQLTKKYGDRISAAAGPLADARIWHRMEQARAEGALPFPNGGRLTACGCANNKLAVRADGEMVPCSLLPHLEMGQINRNSLVEAWQNSPILRELRRRQSISLKGSKCCIGCAYIPYCTGNCPGSAYSQDGEVNHPSRDGCLRRFLQDGGTIL